MHAGRAVPGVRTSSIKTILFENGLHLSLIHISEPELRRASSLEQLLQRTAIARRIDAVVSTCMQGAVSNVGGTQRHSAALKRRSEVIKSHQRSSEVIKSHQRYHQRSSRAISGTHLASAGTSQSGVPVSPIMTEFSAVRSSWRSRWSMSMRFSLRRMSADGRTRLCTCWEAKAPW